MDTNIRNMHSSHDSYKEKLFDKRWLAKRCDYDNKYFTALMPVVLQLRACDKFEVSVKYIYIIK
jgi:hypothetical protein